MRIAAQVGADLAAETAAALKEMTSGIVISPTADIVATAMRIMAS